MNSKYFLLMMLTICKIESHALFEKMIKAAGIGLVQLQKKSINSLVPHRAPELHPVEYPKPKITDEIEQLSHAAITPIAPLLLPALPEEPAKEEIVHGLQKSDYDYLNSCHPKFLATVVKIKEWSPNAVDWLAWTNQGLVKGWMSQLDNEQAKLFCKIKNSADETFEEFLQKTSTLKALYIEARKEFQERTQLAQTACAS